MQKEIEEKSYAKLKSMMYYKQLEAEIQTQLSGVAERLLRERPDVHADVVAQLQPASENYDKIHRIPSKEITLEAQSIDTARSM